MLRWEADQVSEQEFMAAVDAQSEAVLLDCWIPFCKARLERSPLLQWPSA